MHPSTHLYSWVLVLPVVVENIFDLASSFDSKCPCWFKLRKLLQFLISVKRVDTSRNRSRGISDHKHSFPEHEYSFLLRFSFLFNWLILRQSWQHWERIIQLFRLLLFFRLFVMLYFFEVLLLEDLLIRRRLFLFKFRCFLVRTKLSCFWLARNWVCIVLVFNRHLSNLTVQWVQSLSHFFVLFLLCFIFHLLQSFIKLRRFL